MRSNRLCIAATTAALALCSTAAMAQPATDNTGASSTGTSSQAATGGSGQFVTQERQDQWRASKVVGLNVYNNNNEKIGSIYDLLTSRDGTIETAVLSVGGFLGIGTKYVGVSFKALQWSDTAVPSTSASNTGTSPGTTGAGAPTTSGTSATNPPAAQQNTKRDYPDHAVIDMSKDQLNNAPTFQFIGESGQSGK